MGTVKGDLLKEIEKKAKKHKELRQEITDRKKNVEAFILKMVEELDTAAASKAFCTADFLAYYGHAAAARMRTLDTDVKVEILLQDSPKENVSPRLSGILVKWSRDYQIQNNCEAELYVDIAQLLFK